ncbi:hypothetical protein BASA81_004100 [Batrachochytrium salamandrivorans]|nr:hypothetical protein BASA81_004100 [Batrachochytrium salamandrivorans]
MKRILRLVINGSQMPNLIMTVIRYCMMTDNHELKKLLHLYWESVSKTQEDGVTLKPEMVLVVNSLLSDLNHANEYVRGCTLRTLCRVQEAGLISHLVAAIKLNLTNRHAYVRRQAALCMAQIRKRFGEDMVPDCDELLETQMLAETDSATRRDLFLALSLVDLDRAIKFFSTHAEQTGKFGEQYSLTVLELARKTCRMDANKKSRFVKPLFHMLQSESAAVVFEASWTLALLSSAPTAVRAVATSYCQLLHQDADPAVKLVILGKLQALQKSHAKIVSESLMDVLRVLASPSQDIRQKVLDLAMTMVTSNNVDEFVLVLKKEVVKTQAKDVDREEASEYRKMLIQSIHTCAVRFPSIASSVVHVLMDFLNGEGSMDVILFVREIAETQPKMRTEVVAKLMDGLSEIKASNVARGAFWILGEYVDERDPVVLTNAIEAILECLGKMPFVSPEEEQAVVSGVPSSSTALAGLGQEPKRVEITTTVQVLADGTYATQTALSESTRGLQEDLGPCLRKLILDGDWFLAAVCVVCLTKLVLKKARLSATSANEELLKISLVAVSLLKAGESRTVKTKMDSDSRDRISSCIRLLLDSKRVANPVAPMLLGETRQVFSHLVQAKRLEQEKSKAALRNQIKTNPFDCISFRQLKGRNALGAVEEPDDEAQLASATSTSQGSGSSGLHDLQKFVSRTNHRVNVFTSVSPRVAAAELAESSKTATAGSGGSGELQVEKKNIQALTGSTDPVYVEATMVVHDFDIVIHFLVINRTDVTLTNVEVELFIVGDLKLTDRHPTFTLGPRATNTLVTNIKVSSTETGHVFGNVSFDVPNSHVGIVPTLVSLQEIYIDIMNYIRPATCTDSEFRSMWAEFEWENKVAVFTVIPNCRAFLQHIQSLTNMTCLTLQSDMDEGGEDCFLAANLFANSVFGEAALLNLSIEKSGSKIEGFIRIRAKNQGIALSLGDRITMKQKGTELAIGVKQ